MRGARRSLVIVGGVGPRDTGYLERIAAANAPEPYAGSFLGVHPVDRLDPVGPHTDARGAGIAA
ncbi:hypothetical protein ACIHAA_12525 [Streptomyces sp. NPDC052040]|uniref:hypothetical protein n=1 Tax=Streptomyces sp. NPDC052040 TaxID=3365682 RepID=UPI0037D638BC